MNDNYSNQQIQPRQPYLLVCHHGHSSFKQTQPEKHSERPPVNKGHVWLYNGNEQPLNKGHPYITTKILFPAGSCNPSRDETWRLQTSTEIYMRLVWPSNTIDWWMLFQETQRIMPATLCLYTSMHSEWLSLIRDRTWHIMKMWLVLVHRRRVSTMGGSRNHVDQ